jgi:hypothetical protein
MLREVWHPKVHLCPEDLKGRTWAFEETSCRDFGRYATWRQIYPFGSFWSGWPFGHLEFKGDWCDSHKWKAALPRPSLSVPVALASGIPADCCARFGTDQDCWLVLWGAAQRHRWNHWNLDSVQGQILELNFKHSLLKEGEANLWAIGSS